MVAGNPFGIYCVNGEPLYARNNVSAFLGCCTIDPGTTDDFLCPDGKVRPMMFNPDAYNKIPAQECLGNDANALWYSCAATSPPFLGCCTINPCNKGYCPGGYLKGAKLNSKDELATLFLKGINFPIRTSTISSSSSASTASSSSSSTTTTTATTLGQTTAATSATPTLSASATPESNASGHKGIQPATIAGIVVGTAAATLAVALLIFWWLKRKREAVQQNAYTVAGVAPFSPGTQSVTPSTPAWLQGAPSAVTPASTFVPEFHPSPATTTSTPMLPDYNSVAMGQKAMGHTAELPGTFCFELPGDQKRTPHSS